MTIDELKAKIKNETAKLRELANKEDSRGDDMSACAHDTAADYLEKVSRWCEEVK